MLPWHTTSAACIERELSWDGMRPSKLKNWQGSRTQPKAKAAQDWIKIKRSNWDGKVGELSCNAPGNSRERANRKSMEISWQTAFHEEKTRRQVQIVDRLWRHLYLQARCTRLSILYYTFSSVSCLHRRQRTAPTSEFVGASFCLGCCGFFRKPPLPVCFTYFRFCKRGKNDENTWNHMETHGKYACLRLPFLIFLSWWSTATVAGP